jgi:PAS domain S-box-containing protein
VSEAGPQGGARVSGKPRSAPGRVPRLAVAVGTVSMLAVCDALVAPDIVVLGLLVVGPSLAAVSANARGVTAVGVYVLALIAVLSWPDRLWGTLHQLMYVLAAVAVTAVSVVVARRRQALERSAQQSEADRGVLAAIVESSEDAIIGKTLDGVITSWNSGAHRMYGYRASEVLGRSVSLIMGPEEAAQLPCILAQVTRGDRVEPYETRRVHKDGMLLDVSVGVSPIRNSTGTVVGAAAVARDISGRKRAEAERQVLQQRSHQAQRLQSLGQLAGGIAHDFNNLLAVILNYATFVAEQTRDNTAVHADVTHIRTAAERAAGLTRQLLTFARAETVLPEILDLNEIVANVHSLLARSIGEHIELIVARWPTTAMVRADRGQMEQVLLNLAVNARDAMPDGGTLLIETTVAELDDTRGDLQVAPLPAPRPGRYVRVLVSDTGVGMSPEVAAHVFEPFFTTKPRGQGTGLGLATAYGIITAAGGSIEVSSEPDVGTTIRVFLPAVDVPQAPALTRPVKPPPHASGETILVVEDEDAVRDLVVRILDRNGYTVLAASNGPEALKLGWEHPCQLLLTDVIMPDMSGRRLAELMRQHDPHLPVLFMSGYSDGLLDTQRVLDDGIELLQKPFTERDLLDRVHTIVNHPQYTAPNTGSRNGE